MTFNDRNAIAATLCFQRKRPALKMLRTAFLLSACSQTLGAIQLGLLSDLHVGEGCPSPYDGSDNCYSVKNLQLAIARINNVVGPADGLKAIFITGDITSSGELSQYQKARQLLDGLIIPYFPVMGNHDV